MADNYIQTSNLSETFHALRNRDPLKVQRQVMESHPDYRKIPKSNFSPIAVVNTGSWGGVMNRYASAATGGTIYGQPGFFSPVHTSINWQIPSKRLEQYQWARFFYENEPKVGSAIDFYSQFPMSDWEHECRNRKVKLYFDKFKQKLKLPSWCRLMSHEIHLLGDCFPLVEIDCPICGGGGKLGSDICEHEGGTVRRIVILNPDFVEVITSSMNPEPVIALRPDEELINMVQRKTPGYERLSLEVIKLVASGQPIRLDNRNVSHLKYGGSGYQKYGVGMVRRLFPILSYKTKLMVAQWIVAERLIVPIKIVKVGSDERPAGPADIAAVQSQLASTANDPNLTIVTHHAFELDWVGACYSSDTEVLTENGWKNYSDVSKNHDEKIATYNLNNNSMEYQIPTEYHEYDYDGELINFKDDINFDVVVTPNHDMLASENGETWKKVKAENIVGNVYFKNEKHIEDKKDTDFYVEKSHISKIKYNGNVWCFTVPNGFFITRRNGKIAIHGNSGKILTLSNEFEFINQEILDGMMINNALLNGEGPNFTHSADTQLLTNNGLKNILTFDIEKDLVATFNIHTQKLEYQKATRKFVYDWNSIDGDDPPLKRFLTNRIDMLVTPTHKMLLRERKLTTGGRGQKIDGQKEGYGEWKVVRAGNVKNRSRFRACFDGWDGITIEKDEYFGIPTCDFLRIVGWYASEGYRNHIFYKDGTEHVNKVSFSQSPTANAATYEKMETLLAKNNLLKTTPSNPQVFILSKQANEGLVNYLSENMGNKANTKCIPQELKNMSSEKLKILLEALVDGDGSIREATKKKPTNKKYYSYTTVSTQLRDDVIEILFKLGFSPRFNTIRFDESQLQTQYTISWAETETGKFPVLDSRKWDNERKSCNGKSEQVITDEDYVGKVWCVEVPNHFIVTERNGLFGIHGNSSAAVGIEAMIQRLKTFRQQISEWLMEAIYIPEALRQGFVENNPETGEDEVIVPKIKWNSMHLRDQQQDKTFSIQLYEKGLLSAQTVLETFDYDPDQEIERKRYDALQMVALGQGAGQQGGGGGGMGGMPSLGGGMGGEPPIAPGGPGGGGEMGGPGTPPGAPPSPVGGGVGGPPISKSSSLVAEIADPGQFGGRVLKKRTREKISSEQQKQQKMYSQQLAQQQNAQNGGQGGNGQMRDEKGRIVFTGAERQLIPLLKQAQRDGILKDTTIYPQYRVTSGDQEYVIDFAIPNIKLGLEADGEIFHSAPKQVAHDKERDMILAQQGWTIVRFLDSQIEKNPQQVVQEVIKMVMQKQLAIQNQAAKAK